MGKARQRKASGRKARQGRAGHVTRQGNAGHDARQAKARCERTSWGATTQPMGELVDAS